MGQSLTSEKYWRQSLIEEEKNSTTSRSGSAIASFTKFLFALGLIWIVSRFSGVFPAIVDMADVGIDRSVQFLKTLIH